MACAPSGCGGLATISSEVTKLNITIYPYMYIVPEMKVELLPSRQRIGKQTSTATASVGKFCLNLAFAGILYQLRPLSGTIGT